MGNRPQRIVAAADYGMPTLLNTFTSALRRRSLVNHVKQLITTFSFYFRQRLLHIFIFTLIITSNILHCYSFIFIVFSAKDYECKCSTPRRALLVRKGRSSLFPWNPFINTPKLWTSLLGVWQMQPSHNVYVVCFKTTNHIHSCKWLLTMIIILSFTTTYIQVHL